MNLHSLEQQMNEQRRHIRRFCERISELTIAYYNKLPYSTFERTARLNAPVPGSKAPENAALYFLERHYTEDRLEPEQINNKEEIVRISVTIERINATLAKAKTRETSKSALLTQIRELAEKKKNLENENEEIPKKKLICAIDGLFDYPEVTANKSQSLSKWSRTNDQEILVNVLSRHLLLFFSIYPEAAREYGCDLSTETPNFTVLRKEVIHPTCERILLRDWPCFEGDVRLINRIKIKVSNEFEALVTRPKNTELDALLKRRSSSTERQCGESPSEIEPPQGLSPSPSGGSAADAI